MNNGEIEDMMNMFKQSAHISNDPDDADYHNNG